VNGRKKNERERERERESTEVRERGRRGSFSFCLSFVVIRRVKVVVIFVTFLIFVHFVCFRVALLIFFVIKRRRNHLHTLHEILPLFG